MINPMTTTQNSSDNNINDQSITTDSDEESTDYYDNEPVTPRELKAWYLQNMAIEPFGVAAVTVLAPIILETYAGQTGFDSSDLSLPCNTSDPNYSCVTKFGNDYVNTESYSFYVIAISVLLEAFVFISCGALADYGSYKKILMLFFSYLGGLSMVCIIIVYKPELNWLAAILTIFANICYGAVNIFWLAYIPIFSRLLPNVIEAKNDYTKDHGEIEALIEYNANKLSTNGICAGLGSGIILLALCSGIAALMDASTLSLKVGCLIIGIWCILTTTFPLLWLRNRRGPPLPSNENVALYSIKRVTKTLADASQLWQTMKFLLAWFILSDGLSTISSVAIIFGKKLFLMSFTELLGAALLIPVMAIIGAYFFLFVQQRLKLSTKAMVLIVCGFEALVPIYGLFGFFAPFGLKEKWEVWLVATVFGFMLGASQSFCRVLFASLVPKGHENEFFSLFEITDKGSSWIGTLLTGVINDATGNLRYSFLVLTFMMVLPLLVIATVDVEKGKADAEKFLKRQYTEEVKTDNKNVNDGYDILDPIDPIDPVGKKY